MEKDKDQIAMLLKSWSKTQQSRLANMRKFRVRAVPGNEKFYGTISLLKNYIILVPEDAHIQLLCFDERRLRGCKEIATKGIKLIPMLQNERPISIFFATSRYRSAALESIRCFIGDDSTESSIEKEEELLPGSSPAEQSHINNE